MEGKRAGCKMGFVDLFLQRKSFAWAGPARAGLPFSGKGEEKHQGAPAPWTPDILERPLREAFSAFVPTVPAF